MSLHSGPACCYWLHVGSQLPRAKWSMLRASSSSRTLGIKLCMVPLTADSDRSKPFPAQHPKALQLGKLTPGPVEERWGLALEFSCSPQHPVKQQPGSVGTNVQGSSPAWLCDIPSPHSAR